MKKLLVAIYTILLTLPLAANNIDTAAIDSFISHIEHHNQGIGAIAIADKGKIVYHRNFGQQAVTTHNNLYRIGSITKLFTATIIHRLCANGKLSLDTTLDTFFPHFSTADSITIRHMLSHTSGLGDYTSQSGNPTWLMQPVSDKEILSEIIHQGISDAPGKKQRYSNTAYYLLHRIIERIYNTSYNNVVEQEIIKPLALLNTFANQPESITPAPPYRLNTSNQWQEVNDFYFPNVEGVGNMISNPQDLCYFINALYNKQLIDSTTLTLMQPTAGTAFGSGLMYFPFYQHAFYGHAGDTYGSHTVIMHNPTDSISIALCLNGCATPRNDILIGICSSIYNTEFTYPQYDDLQQYQAPVNELQNYVGVYNSAIINLPIHIELQDNNLIFYIEGQPHSFLESKSPGIFINSPTGVGIAFRDKDRFVFKQNNQLIIFNRIK